MLSKFAAILLIGLAGLPAILVDEELFRVFEQLAAGHQPTLLMVTGVLAGTITYRAIHWYSDGFWSTAHHELAHACVATLVGGKPARMLVNAGSGHMNWVSPSGQLSVGRHFLVLIAPYCFSPISLCLGVLLLSVPSRSSVFLLIASLAAGIGLAAPIFEIHVWQRDLRQGGMVVSTICSLWLWTSTAVVLLMELSGRTGAAAIGVAYVRAYSKVALFLTSMLPV